MERQLSTAIRVCGRCGRYGVDSASVHCRMSANVISKTALKPCAANVQSISTNQARDEDAPVDTRYCAKLVHAEFDNGVNVIRD